jgi:hypothetical protein
MSTTDDEHIELAQRESRDERFKNWAHDQQPGFSQYSEESRALDSLPEVPMTKKEEEEMEMKDVTETLGDRKFTVFRHTTGGKTMLLAFKIYCKFYYIIIFCSLHVSDSDFLHPF